MGRQHLINYIQLYYPEPSSSCSVIVESGWMHHGSPDADPPTSSVAFSCPISLSLPPPRTLTLLSPCLQRMHAVLACVLSVESLVTSNASRDPEHDFFCFCPFLMHACISWAAWDVMNYI
ncbi:hypothetical protein M758_10G185400 [Ceratodon purpureus]|nr:hypothetical protein M758_10G185400 [Ceratodon purpureus]